MDGFNNIGLKIGDIQMPDLSRILTPQVYDPITPEIQQELGETFERKKQAHLAAIEQTEITKGILKETKQMNESLIQVNKGLEKINDSLEKQLQAINDNIDFAINAIGANAQIDETQERQKQQLLIEIQMLLRTKDEKGLKVFMQKNIGNGIGLAGLLLQGISML